MNNSTSETQPRKIDVAGDDAPENQPPDNDVAANDPSPTGDKSDAGAELARFRDLAHRNQADLENFKKRAAREKEDAVKYANANLLERLVAIVDNFELGLAAAKNESHDSPILSGMGMVLKQLTDFLAENGLQPIDAAGKKFDPNLHEAIAHEPHDRVPAEHVVKQLRRGYKLKDRLLRPSTVVVSSGPAA